MRLELIIGLQILIVAFIAYIITIPLAGWFEAFVAKKMGDDAPEEAGFLTVNPLEHFNVFGFAAVLWGIFFAHVLPFQFIPGWGRYIPLVPDNIRGSYYKVRIFIEYISRAIAHLFILLTAATIMMLTCGAMHVQGMVPMIKASQTTSFKEALLFLLFFLCQQNLVLFVIHSIVGIFKYILYFYMPRIQEISFITILSAFILLLVGLSVFGPLLEVLVFTIIESIRSLLLMISK